MKTIAFTVALAVAITGCGGDDDTDPDPPGGSGPLVTYTKSGGIAGVYEHLEVAEDGAATLEVGFRDPARGSFELETEELEHLRELLAAADFAGVGPDRGLSCADCFQYEVEYAGETAAFAEIGDIPESVGAVVAELGRIVEAHAPSPAAPG
jgi:hypothetical protein